MHGVAITGFRLEKRYGDVTTLVVPDGGRVSVLGHDVVTEGAAVRGMIAVAGQHPTVDAMLTGRENLRLVGTLAQLPWSQVKVRADELLAEVGLADAASGPVAGYSGGTQQVVFATVQPVMIVLMFRYVLGGAIRVPDVAYVDYLMPGVFAQAIASGPWAPRSAWLATSRPATSPGSGPCRWHGRRSWSTALGRTWPATWSSCC